MQLQLWLGDPESWGQCYRRHNIQCSRRENRDTCKLKDSQCHVTEGQSATVKAFPQISEVKISAQGPLIYCQKVRLHTRNERAVEKGWWNTNIFPNCASCEVRTEFICYVEESRPRLWSSGQSSWLQIHRAGFNFRRYQIFWEVAGLERGSLSLMSTTEELLKRKSSGSGLENRDCGCKDPPRWPGDTPLLAKVCTNVADKRRSVGIVRSRTQDTEFLVSFLTITDR
jgi:hypothetical protein